MVKLLSCPVSILAIPMAMVALAEAACPSRCRVQAVEVVAAPAILVPSYGGSYGQQAPQSNDDLIRRLVEVLERLEARLDQPAGGHTLESITKQSCAKCHTEGQKPQADFVLFDREGKAIELSLGDKRAVRGRITSRDANQVMPPGKPLDSGRQAVMLQGLK